MKMQSISTKTGDRGESGLANGERLPKEDLVFEVLGTQDELNSWIGLSLVHLSDDLKTHKAFLQEIQDTLFYIGAELARSPKVKLQRTALQKLERRAEKLQQSMEKNWVTKFLYPGGSEAAATLDVTRTVSRRFERLVVRYARQQPVSPIILKYVNRLSDYFYVLRCFVNQHEKYQEKIFDTSKKTYKQTVFKKKK